MVIPAFNERSSIATVIAEVREAAPGAEILVVDDGSADATTKVARAAGAAVVRLSINLGVGAAMRTGFRYAQEYGFGIVVQVDADGQHDPGEMPELVAALSESDVVIGARFAGRGDYSVSWIRGLAMRMLSVVLSRLAGTRLSDVTSGFRASGPRAVDFFAREYPAEYLGDTIESLVLASRAGLRIQQVPVVMRERSAGQPSHRPFKAAVYLGRAVMALTIALMRQPPQLPPTEA